MKNCKIGQSYKVTKIDCDGDVTKRLNQLSVYVGGQVQIVKRYYKGSSVVLANYKLITIGGELIDKIFVE